MIHGRSVVSAFAAVVPFFVVGLAQGSVMVCNGCTAEQASQRASQVSVPSSGPAEVYVADYHNVSLWRCEVWWEREIFPPGKVAFCGPASPSLQAEFEDLAIAISAANKSIEIDYPGGNIYEISGCPACARSWLLDNQGALASKLSLVDIARARGWALGGRMGGRGADMEATVAGQVRIKLVLRNDASGAPEKGFCFADVTSNGVQVDVDSCVDGDGNPIPTLNNPNIQVTYAFNSPINHGQMVIRLRAVGRTVRGSGTVTVSPLISCTSQECEADEPIDDEDNR
ncbi:MAG: hypothetical protein ACXIUZ_02385 [Lysobacteraceae bacterium]